MKQIKLLLMSIAVFALCFTACQDNWLEEKPVTNEIPLTYEQEFAVINKYTSIDTVNHRFTAFITDEIMKAERLTPHNVDLIMKEMDKTNKRIEADIKNGYVITLTANNAQGFQIHTANVDRSAIKFIDTPLSKANTRGAFLASMPFNNGSWYDPTVTFEGSDHVTSTVSVSSCTGYWSMTVTCKTGTSSYGDVFRAYGSSPRSGFNRYWWYTAGGSAPYRWTFIGNGPVSGEANGSFEISNTY